MSPSPDRFHQDVVLNLATILKSYLQKKHLGRVYVAPSDVELDEHNVLQPDIYFVSIARSSILTPHGVSGAPDLVVEILSPGTARLDLEEKRQVYARGGVIEMWVIVPETRQVQIYRLQENPERPAVIYEQTDAFESPIFPGLTIEASKVFAE